MPDSFSARTLHLNRSFGQGLSLLLFTLAIIFGSLELLARTDLAHTHLPIPDLRSSNAQFETKIALLDQLVRHGQKIDCVFIGSSMAESALDPALFAQGYRQITGSGITCFNISLDGLGPKGAEAVARLMIQRYRVRLVIWGTSARDYTLKGEAYWSEWHAKVLGPWGRHVLGEPTLEGWLLDRSIAYRRLIRLQRFITQKNYPAVYAAFYQTLTVDAYGYEPRTIIDPGIDFSQPPSASEQRELFGGEGELSLVSLTYLPQLAQLYTANSQIILVELPVHPTYFEYFEGGQSEYDQIMTSVRAVAQVNNLLFWSQAHLPAMPDTGWNDRYHLRVNGATVLSEWLGQQIGTAVIEGVILDPLQPR